jgi:co-chaperonin GroES (HSP10)
MIQAVADKIIVEIMRATKTTSGLLLPESSDPQGYGRVISCGELLSETNIKEGTILVFHLRAGMDMLMNKRILKVLKYEELYGILEDKEIEDTLDVMKLGGSSEGQQLVQPATRIIQ